MAANDDHYSARILFSALLPATRLAIRALKPLRDMKQLMELAYYREARRQGLKMREIRDLLNVSMSKVGLLSSHLKAHFGDAEQELPRRIMGLLWATPLTETKITQALSDAETEDVKKALALMLKNGQIQTLQGRTVTRYQISAPQYRLVQEGWLARIDGLNHLMTSVFQAVTARFFEQDANALARTLSFRVKEDDMGRLKEAYDEIYKLVVSLDEQATTQDAPTVPVTLSFLVSTDPDIPESSEEES